MTRVVHCKKEPYDVYIGRPGEWGNPFRIGPDGDRKEVLRKYKLWFWEQFLTNQKFRVGLYALRGKTLGCWCKPEACHGDIIADYVNCL